MKRSTSRVGFAGLGAMVCLLFVFGCPDSGVRSASRSSPGSTTGGQVAPANARNDGEVAATSESNPQSAAPVDVSKASSSSAEKPKDERKPIYDVEAKGEDLIAKAVRRAKRDGKQVLIEWGGNWCGWCHLLHDTFKNAPGVKELVYEEYELVLVDSNTNRDLMAEYGGKDRQFSYPHLTVLDASGKVLTNQNTEPLEEGRGHSAAKVAAFLRQWMLPKVDAEQLVAAEIERAEQQGKRVLLRFGTPYCGWCKVLAQFLQDHEALFGKDYIDVKVDTERMSKGEDVVNKYRPPNCNGVPWFIILDGKGDVLRSSVGKAGNIGYPSEPDEVAHFVQMLRDTRQSLTDVDLASIEADLHAARAQRGR